MSDDRDETMGSQGPPENNSEENIDEVSNDQAGNFSLLKPIVNGVQRVWNIRKKWFFGSAPTQVNPAPEEEAMEQAEEMEKDVSTSLQMRYRRTSLKKSANRSSERISLPFALREPPSTQVHTQVDYTHFLIPEQQEIINCSFYWGKIDRYEAEALLANKPEGSFLLRDSAQDDFVFSVSFRRYSRSLHARIEEANHMFSFDCHDPGVHASHSIRGLLQHYQDPHSCMFFEPLLLYGIARNNCFSLQTLARSVVCDNLKTYSDVNKLPIPKTLKSYLKEYHYKHKLRTRFMEAAS